MVIIICPTCQEFYFYEYRFEAAEWFAGTEIVCGYCRTVYPIQPELKRMLHKL